MGKKRNLDDDMGQEGEGGGGDGRLHITDEIRQSIEYVINEKDKLKMQQDAIKEAITAIASLFAPEEQPHQPRPSRAQPRAGAWFCAPAVVW